ncbi:hypothetical protein JCM15519_17660 [Fundidesulfovibrio butyratiphilus]
MKIVLVQIDLVLGARVLLKVLEARGFDVEALQINITYVDEFTDQDLETIYTRLADADVVGLSYNSFYATQGERLCRYIRARRPDQTLILGGPHATAMPEAVLEHSDIVVLFEAEVALPQVLDALDDPQRLHAIPGVLTHQNRGPERHRSPELAWDLDSVPFQSIDTNRITYFSRDKGLYSPETRELFASTDDNYLVLGSRGCPFSCTYCSNSLYHALDKRNRKVRKRSVDNIVDEMRHAVDHGFESFYIADDNFFSFSVEEIRRFHDLYGALRRPFSVVGINPNNFRDKDSVTKLRLLLDCGLSDIRVGVQSGSDKTLSRFRRGYKARELPELLRPIDQYRDTIFPAPFDKLHVALDFICDSPWEDEADRQSTVRLANVVLEQFTIFFYTLVYLPGTKLYNEAVEQGLITDHTRDIFHRGIAGVDDIPTNRLLFLIGTLKERGASLDPDVLDHLLHLSETNPPLFERMVDSQLAIVKQVESHHRVDLKHGAIHPYLSGFNTWTKQTGDVGRKVLFRSYHRAYG